MSGLWLSPCIALLPTVSLAQSDCDPFLVRARDEVVRIVDERGAPLEGDADAIRRIIDEKVRPHFDLAYGSSKLLARYWDDATPDQRLAFVQAFYNWLVAGYGPLLIYFDDDTLELGTECLPSTRLDEVIVYQPGQLRLNDDSLVALNFVLHEDDGHLLIIDILADGISQVASFRQQFESRLRREGLGAMISWLEQEAELPNEQTGR